MGYTANGFGTIQTICELPDELLDKFVDMLGGPSLGIDVSEFEHDGTHYIDVSYNDRYDEFYFAEALDSIRSFVSNGCIEFCGEDDEHWRFKFDPVKSEWIEENGVIVYNADEALDYAQSEFRRLTRELNEKEAN